MKSLLLTLASFLMLAQATFAQSKETLTNKAVVDLVKSGLDNDIIISKIESSTGKYDLSTTGLVALKKDGVPSDVIKAMMNKASGKAPVTTPTNPNTPTTQPLKAKAKDVPHIELINVVYGYDSKANAIKELEKVIGELKGKITAKSLFVPLGGPVNLYYRIPNEKSSVRLSANDSLSFLVNSDKGAPEGFTLYKLDSQKGKREAVYYKDNEALVGNKKVEKKAIPYHYVRLNDAVFRIIPDTKLEAGEYCFVYDFSLHTYDSKKADGYAFGVD